MKLTRKIIAAIALACVLAALCLHGAGASAAGGTGTESGDMPFRLATPNLPQNTLYLLQKSIYSGFALPKQHDAARLITSLQGLINREFSTNKALLYWADVSAAGTDAFWKEYLQTPGKLLDGMNEVHIGSLNDFLSTFSEQLKACGLVAWDPQVASTANVAATICGLDGYLPVRFDTAPGSVYNALANMGVTVKLSLVSKFTGSGTIPETSRRSTGSAKNDAYLWALDNYMDRCSNKYIAYMPDGASGVETNETYIKTPAGPEWSSIFNHDYLIARRCFFFDLFPHGGETPSDDRGQPPGTDLNTTKAILQRRWDLAGGSFGQLVGFVPWHLKYTDFNGNNTVVPTELEWIFARLVTTYNLAKEADAAMPCWLANASAYYQSPAKAQYTNNRPASVKSYDPDTIYLLLYLGDYDSSAWMARHVPETWNDPNRGSSPNMWAYNPNLIDRIPMAFDYIYENKRENDYFTAGDSGAGYVMPYALYPDPEIRPRESGARAWLAYNEPYNRRLGLDVCGFIINGWKPLDTDILDLYSAMYPGGNLHNDPGKPLMLHRGVPFVHLMNGAAAGAAGTGGPADIDYAKREMYNYLNTTMRGTNFGAFRTVVTSPTENKQIREAFLSYAAQQNPGQKYEFVDVYTFMDLIRQSGHGVFPSGPVTLVRKQQSGVFKNAAEAYGKALVFETTGKISVDSAGKITYKFAAVGKTTVTAKDAATGKRVAALDINVKWVWWHWILVIFLFGWVYL